MFNVHCGADTCVCVAGENGKNEDKYKARAEGRTSCSKWQRFLEKDVQLVLK